MSRHVDPNKPAKITPHRRKLSTVLLVGLPFVIILGVLARFWFFRAEPRLRVSSVFRV